VLLLLVRLLSLADRVKRQEHRIDRKVCLHASVVLFLDD
jgi:hypothetical protein